MEAAKVGKKTVENLVAAGCFDFTGWSRDALRQSIERCMKRPSKNKKKAVRGIMDLFARVGDNGEARFKNPPEVLASGRKWNSFKEKGAFRILPNRPSDG